MFKAGDSPDLRARLTLSVLYAIFPAVAAGFATSWWRVKYMRRPLEGLRAAFQDIDNIKDFRAVFRFKDAAQVTRLHQPPMEQITAAAAQHRPGRLSLECLFWQLHRHRPVCAKNG